MNEDLKEAIGIVSAALLLVAGLVFTIGGASILVERAACNRVANISHVSVCYDWLAGCFVELDGQYVPIKRWLHLQKGTPST